jgi:hypothetical protein
VVEYKKSVKEKRALEEKQMFEKERVECESTVKSLYLNLLSSKNLEKTIIETVEDDVNAKSCILQPDDDLVLVCNGKLKYITRSKHLCPLLKESDEVKRLLASGFMIKCFNGDSSTAVKIYWEYEGEPEFRIKSHKKLGVNYEDE